GLFRQGPGISGSLAQAIDGGHETWIPLADRLVILRRLRFAGHGQPLSNGRTPGSSLYCRIAQALVRDAGPEGAPNARGAAGLSGDARGRDWQPLGCGLTP